MHSPNVHSCSASFEAESGDTCVTPGEEGRDDGEVWGRVYLRTAAVQQAAPHNDEQPAGRAPRPRTKWPRVTTQKNDPGAGDMCLITAQVQTGLKWFHLDTKPGEAGTKMRGLITAIGQWRSGVQETTGGERPPNMWEKREGQIAKTG